MAKVVVTFDTNDKTCEVKVGGKVLENLSNISFSKKMPMEYGGMEDEEEEDEFSCYISQAGDEKDGMRQCQRTYANSKTGEFIPVKIEETDYIAKEIAEYLKKVG